MPVEAVALIPRCAECEAAWLPADEERWQAHLGCDEFLDAPAEVVFRLQRKANCTRKRNGTGSASRAR